MSKIEVCSIHCGEIVVSTPNGVKSAIFKEFGLLNVAEVDEDVAEVLLGKIGVPEYFKRTFEMNTTSASAPDADKGEPEVTTLTLDSYGEINNINKLKSVLKKCDSSDLLMSLIAFETQNKNRDGFLAALTARFDDLK